MDSLSVVPRVGVPPFKTAPQVYGNISELFDYFFAVRRPNALEACDSEQSRAYVEELFAALDVYTRGLIRELPSHMLRCVLAHDDLNDNNVLLDETTGKLTGVIDWEYHSVIPICLAVEYPRFLRRDGRYDPRFCPANTWWLESPDESERLLTLFEQASVHT